jgi:hypothetical protein
MTNAQYQRLVLGLVGVWLVVTTAASAQGMFDGGPGRPPLAFGLAALTPIVLFAAWFALSAGFRGYIRSLSPATLTFLQSWRIVGAAFLVLYAYALLPGVFALPAGWGDLLIGVTAPFVALNLAKPGHRGSFIAWQFLGVADLVIAVTAGTTAGFLAPHSASTESLTKLPLSMIPTFGVPLLMIVHFICIGQALRWPKQVSKEAAGAELRTTTA